MSKHIALTGASKGIGRETARFLAENNCNVTAIARSATHLETLKKEFPGQIYPLTLDINEKDAPQVLMHHLRDKKLKLDGFIHNAGLLINKPFTELTDKDWDAQINVNLFAPVRLTRDLVPFFNKHSHILHISSMGGFQGSSKFPGLTAYSVTKGALSIFSECLSVELAEYSIASNTLCLGAVQTEMLGQAFPGLKAPVTASEMGKYVGDFILEGHKYYNGKILPVAINNPE